MESGGLPVLPASVGSGEYEGYLAVIPGEILAEIYVKHGSRLLEGNVRTFLGRGGKVNKGIAVTVANEPGQFFAYNNGIAAPARAIAENVQVPLAMAANSVLATASLAAQAHADVFMPRVGPRPLSLFVLTVAGSGDRKTSADSVALAHG
jgi:hypothetical protein